MSLLGVAGVVASTGLMAGTAYAADLTTAERIVCTPSKGARCKKDGSCEWREPTARDKSNKLAVDFKAKTAHVTLKKGPRSLGAVIRDEIKDGVRHVSIARRPDQDPKNHLVFTVDKDGKMKGSRSSGRIRFEAMCETP